MKKLIGLCLLGGLLSGGLASASVEQMVVTNCSGDVMAAQVSETGAPNSIVAWFGDSATGHVSLECDGTEARSVAIVDGRASFASVPTSSCRICAVNGNLVPERVALSRSEAAGTASWSKTTWGGIAGLGGAAAIAGLAIDDGGSGDSATVGALGQPEAAGSDAISVSAGSSRIPAPASADSVSISAADDCLNAQRPDVLSPFF